MTEGQRGRTWARWAGEAIVIVVSVFVAIYLEGAADDAERVDEANGILAQIVAELTADRQAIPEILEQQAVAAGTYGSLLRWLTDSQSVPGDSVQAALDYLRDNNRTLYPISGAWRALMSGGHLVWIRDQRLVARLAAFYENRTVQLEYNGRDYDFNLNDVLRVTASRAWDFERQSPRANGTSDLVELRGQLRYLGESWNPYYVSLLSQYGTEIDELLRELEAYLSGGGDT